VLILSIALTKDEGVMEKYDFPVNIFYNDVKCFSSPVDLLIPAEIGNN
jgi:hypothetical protein